MQSMVKLQISIKKLDITKVLLQRVQPIFQTRQKRILYKEKKDIDQDLIQSKLGVCQRYIEDSCFIECLLIYHKWKEHHL